MTSLALHVEVEICQSCGHVEKDFSDIRWHTSQNSR